MLRSMLAACLCTAAVFAQAHTAAPTTAQWREDLRTLAATLPLRHRNLYHTVARDKFEAAIAALDARLDGMPRHQVIIEMARIVAMVGDGHTNIAPTRDPAIGFHAFPVAMYLFADGLYFRAAGQRYKDLVGARVLSIGGVPVAQAFAAVRQVISGDNPQNALYFAPHFLAMPEVLQALGMSESLERARFELERDGKTWTVELADAGPAPMMPPDTDMSFTPRPGWTDARASTPAWLADAGARFRFDYERDGRLLYVQLNQVGNEAAESMQQFAERMSAFIDANPVDKLVLDLRLNRGGNGDLVPPVIKMMVRARHLDRPGHLFTIIGRSTFSAAQFMANDIEKYTNAIFVGEPTGGKPNSYGDSRKTVLPNSGLTVRASTLWWQTDQRDKRQWIAPSLAADLTFDSYRRGIDPAMAAIRSYRPAPALAEILLAGAPAAGSMEQRYQAWRSLPANRYADAQRQLHRAGYELLAAGRAGDAVAVFTIWSANHPDSANAFDSLGEALLAKGDKPGALAAYQQALRIDASMASAIDAVRKLQQ